MMKPFFLACRVEVTGSMSFLFILIAYRLLQLVQQQVSLFGLTEKPLRIQISGMDFVHYSQTGIMNEWQVLHT